MWNSFHVLHFLFQSIFSSLTPLHLLFSTSCQYFVSSPVPFCIACLASQSAYFLFSPSVFTIQPLSTERDPVLELLSEQSSAGFAASFPSFGSPFVTTLPLWGRVCWFTFSSQQRHMILVQCTGCFQSCLTRVGSQPRAGRTLPMFLEREKQQQ